MSEISLSCESVPLRAHASKAAELDMCKAMPLWVAGHGLRAREVSSRLILNIILDIIFDFFCLHAFLEQFCCCFSDSLHELPV